MCQFLHQIISMVNTHVRRNRVGYSSSKHCIHINSYTLIRMESENKFTLLFMLWTLKSEISLLFFKTTETIDACGYTRCNPQSWPEYLKLNTQSQLSSKCFNCSGYVTYYACFYVMQAVKMPYFVEVLQLTHRS